MFLGRFRRRSQGQRGEVALRVHGDHRDAGSDGLLEERLSEDRLASTGRAEDHDMPEQRVLRRSEEHTSELQSPCNLVCRLLLEKKKKKNKKKGVEIV